MSDIQGILETRNPSRENHENVHAGNRRFQATDPGVGGGKASDNPGTLVGGYLAVDFREGEKLPRISEEARNQTWPYLSGTLYQMIDATSTRNSHGVLYHPISGPLFHVSCCGS